MNLFHFSVERNCKAVDHLMKQMITMLSHRKTEGREKEKKIKKEKAKTKRKPPNKQKQAETGKRNPQRKDIPNNLYADLSE